MTSPISCSQISNAEPPTWQAQSLCLQRSIKTSALFPSGGRYTLFPFFQNCRSSSPVHFVKQEMEEQSDLFTIFRTQITKGGKKEKGLMVASTEKGDQKNHPLQAKFAFHEAAASKDLALPIEKCEVGNRFFYSLKETNSGPLAFALATNPLSQKEKIQIAERLVSKVQQLHEDCKIYHQNIHPWNIMTQKNNELDDWDVWLTNFLGATDEPLLKEKGLSKNSNPPEYEYSLSMTRQELENHPYGAKTTDLYKLGLTLYTIFKNECFERKYREYLFKPHNKELYYQELQEVTCLDDFSVLRDNSIRDFLQFQLQNFPNEVFLAIRGLLRTIPDERISLRQVLTLLRATT
jgi:hypothetical protein